MAYSVDFRKKVFEIKAKEGLSFREVAKRFGIGFASVVRWSKNIEPKLKRDKPPTKIDMEALEKDVEDYPDAYQRERAERLGVSKNCIYCALKRLGVTYKKSPKTPKSERRRTYKLL